MSFIEKFFGYLPRYNNELNPYCDNLGKGFLDIRHLIWIILVTVITILLIKIKDNKDKTKIIKILLTFTFIQRFIVQLSRTILAAENPFWRAAFPIHLCSIMIFLLPIVVIFNINKIKKPVYFLSILGGVITILVGDYFDSAFMSYYTLEGIFAHSMLVIAPITLLSIEKERFVLKDVFNTLIGIIIISVWSTLFNSILGSLNIESNYLFLVSNMLPFGDKYFCLIYELIFIIILIVTYILSNIKNKKEVIKEIKNNKYKIIIYILLLLILGIIISNINYTFAINK